MARHSLTRWRNLQDLDLTLVPGSPGAYQVATNRPLARTVGVDPLGIIDIGESTNLRKRLKNFMRCAAQRGQEGHMAAWRYNHFHLERHLPLASLRVRWVVTKDKPAAYRAECKMLNRYLHRHCELPPLNYKFNWDMFD